MSEHPVAAALDQPTPARYAQMPWWKNPGLYVAIASPAAVILNQRFGVHLNGEELAIVLSGLVTATVGIFHHGAMSNRNGGGQ